MLIIFFLAWVIKKIFSSYKKIFLRNHSGIEIDNVDRWTIRSSCLWKSQQIFWCVSNSLFLLLFFFNWVSLKLMEQCWNGWAAITTGECILIKLRSSGYSSWRILIWWRHLLVLHIEVYIWEWFALTKQIRMRCFEHAFLTKVWCHISPEYLLHIVCQPIILPRRNSLLLISVYFLTGNPLGFYQERTHMINGVKLWELFDNFTLAVCSFTDTFHILNPRGPNGGIFLGSQQGTR